MNDSPSWFDRPLGRLVMIFLIILALWAVMTLAGALSDWYRSARHSFVLHHDMRAAL